MYSALTRDLIKDMHNYTQQHVAGSLVCVWHGWFNLSTARVILLFAHDMQRMWFKELLPSLGLAAPHHRLSNDNIRESVVSQYSPQI